MYVLNNEAQNTLKMPSVRKLIYKNQVDRKNIIGVLTAPATQDEDAEKRLFSL